MCSSLGCDEASGVIFVFSIPMSADKLAESYRFEPMLPVSGIKPPVFLLTLWLFALQLPAQSFVPLHTFGEGQDGAFPCAVLLLENGTLFGTTTVGGPWDGGTLFRVILAPEIEANAGLVQSNVFGFSVLSFSNNAVVVEANSNLLWTGWVPLQTNILENTESFSFADPLWGQFPQRFYRVRLQ